MHTIEKLFEAIGNHVNEFEELAPMLSNFDNLATDVKVKLVADCKDAAITVIEEAALDKFVTKALLSIIDSLEAAFDLKLRHPDCSVDYFTNDIEDCFARLVALEPEFAEFENRLEEVMIRQAG